MHCKNCNELNEKENKFCAKCGKKLEVEKEEVSPNNEIKNDVSKTNIKSMFKFVMNMIIKPVSTSKSDITIKDNTKNSLILTGIVALLLTITNVIYVIFNVVKTTKSSFFSSNVETVWQWEKFKVLDAVITPFLTMFAIIAGLAFLYYVIGLILKKEVKYSRFLTYAAISVIPYAIVSLVLIPFITNFQIILILYGISLAFSLIYLIILSLNEFKIDDNDTKFYVYFIITAIIISFILYYITSSFISSIESSSNIFDFF